MENLSKKQKIVLYIIGGLVIVLIIIYLFTKNDTTVYSDYSNLYLEGDKNQEINLEEIKNSIYVYVSGEVNNPSVVELHEGARVSEAIEKAGGLTDSGEVKDINLAYKLNDGEKLYIPSLDEFLESKENNTNIQYISSGIVSDSRKNNNDDGGSISENVNNNAKNNDDNNSNSSNNNGLVNINTSSQTELETLDGIGPSTAKKIIDYRKENGAFKSIEDVKNVSGIGDAKYNSIKDKICV